VGYAALATGLLAAGALMSAFDASSLGECHFDLVSAAVLAAVTAVLAYLARSR
jgi:hypothetical protein